MAKRTLTTRVTELEQEVEEMKAIISKIGPEVKEHTQMLSCHLMKFGHIRSWATGVQAKLKQYQINPPISKRKPA